MITNLNEFLKKNHKSKVNEDLEPTPTSGNAKTYTVTMSFQIKDLDVNSNNVDDPKTSIKNSLSELITKATHDTQEQISNLVVNVEESTNEGIGSFVSNIVNDDKKMGETLTKNLNTYIKTKPSNLAVTPEDMTKAFELAKVASFYTKDIKFENDAQKQAWDYLKQRAQKSMRFGSSGGITPAS